MKGVGWEASKSLDVQQAKKAGELVSEVAYDPECIAEISRPKYLTLLDQIERGLHLRGFILNLQQKHISVSYFYEYPPSDGNCSGAQM